MKKYLKPGVFILSLIPFLIITYKIFFDLLGPEPVKEITEVKEEPVVTEAPKKRRKNRRRIMLDTPEGQAVIIHNKNGHQVSWIANKVGRTYRQVWDFLKDNGYEINKKTS